MKSVHFASLHIVLLPGIAGHRILEPGPPHHPMTHRSARERKNASTLYSFFVFRNPVDHHHQSSKSEYESEPPSPKHTAGHRLLSSRMRPPRGGGGGSTAGGAPKPYRPKGRIAVIRFVLCRLRASVLCARRARTQRCQRYEHTGVGTDCWSAIVALRFLLQYSTVQVAYYVAGWLLD